LLAFDLVTHYLPDLDGSSLLEVMHTRLEHQTPACEGTLDSIIEDDMFAEVVGIVDKKPIKDHLQTRKKDHEHRSAMQPKLNAFVRRKCVQLKKPIKPGSLSAKVDLLKLTTKSGMDRWWSSVVGDLGWIKEWLPPRGSVFQDDPNGRWRITYPGGKIRSISWTKVGMEAASITLLKQMWKWHTDRTGEACPLALVGMQEQVRE
jgi:hypothetical protein